MTGFDQGSVEHTDVTVGATLRLARDGAGLSQDELAKFLNLRLTQIVAIEEDRSDSLPPLAYATGFVRSYARRVGLDAEQIAAAYKAQMTGQLKGAATTEEFIAAQHVAAGNGSLNLRPILVGLTALLLAGGAGAGWAYLSGYSQTTPVTAKLEAAPPQAGVMPVASTARTVNKADLNIAPLKEVVLTKPGTDTAAGQEQSAAPDLNAGAPLQPVADKFIYTITALDMSWVKITDADGVELANQIMRPGQQLRMERAAKMTLTTGNLAGLAIEINGEEIPDHVRNSAQNRTTARSGGSAMRSITLDATALLTNNQTVTAR